MTSVVVRSLCILLSNFFTLWFPKSKSVKRNTILAECFRERLRWGVPTCQYLLLQDGPTEGASQPQCVGVWSSRLLCEPHSDRPLHWDCCSVRRSGGRWGGLVSQSRQLASRSVSSQTTRQNVESDTTTKVRDTACRPTTTTTAAPTRASLSLTWPSVRSGSAPASRTWSS